MKQFFSWAHCLATVFASAALFAAGDEPAMRWGEVPMDQLTMVTFPADTNAKAVILFDIGRAHFDEHYDLFFTRHTRIKILKKGGFEWGTKKIRYYSSRGTQRIKEIEGHTIRLNEGGQVVKQKLDDESIFEENMGENWKEKRFTLPGLTEGCVVEWRYTVVSNNPLYMPNWDFQMSEPVLWSEFTYKAPNVFTYVTVTQGHIPLLVNTADWIKEPFMTSGAIRMTDVLNGRFVVKDAPALREEPFITTLDDYRSRAFFQLSFIQWPGEIPRKFLHTWDKLVEELLENQFIGKQLTGFGDVRRQAEEVTKGIEDPLKKMEAIHAFVRKTIVWNERRSMFVNSEIDEVLEKKTGNSAEVNLLLTAMLKDAGLQADPLILSTRGHGKIQTVYPIYDQFDYVICRVRLGGKEYFLDATDTHCPMALLPRRALNYVSLAIAKGPAKWVEIKPSGKVKQSVLIHALLPSEGALQGTTQMKFEEYGAVDERSALASKREEDYFKTLFKTETSGLSVDSAAVQNKDDVNQPLLVDAKISAPAYCQVLDDFVYMNPHIVERTTENPFKLEVRDFPVDFAVGADFAYTLLLTIPDGYALQTFPKDLSLGMASQAATYTRRSELKDNVFQMTIRFQRNQTRFEPPAYPSLRGFYGRIVAAENEQLVLQKKKAPEPALKPAGKSVDKKGKK
jgi:hypothetical protein